MTLGARESPDKSIELPGLEPDNLLAFLALLGLLRALEVDRPIWHPRVAWHGQPPRAMLVVRASADAEEVVSAADRGIRMLGRSYRFDRADIKFTVGEFRAYAELARGNLEQARLAAALASDGVTKRDDQTVATTALCAMFGQGHQHFLARMSAAATRDHPGNVEDLRRALSEPWRYEDKTEGFRWDPIEDRRYAHQFGDPSDGKNKIGTVAGANRLAVIGFAALTSVPTSGGLATLGIFGRRGEQDVCWPLLGEPTSFAGYCAVLAHPWLGSESMAPALAAYGVRGVARARRFQVGKFFNFERARVQILA